MTNNHKLILGDSRDMSEIDDQSMHLVVTSPPYWQIKDYGVDEQIGFQQTYQDYITGLDAVWSQCYKKLHNGCRLCVNVGDQFTRTTKKEKYHIIPIRSDIIRSCLELKFEYMGAVIWQKVTNCNPSGGASIMGSFPYPRNGVVKIDYEFILIFRKPGDAPQPTKEDKIKSKLTNEEWNQYFYGHWNFSGAKSKDHLAPFPEELPKRLIKMYSFVGENILDPFVGSGTTSAAAVGLHRNSIGYDINRHYIDIAANKIREKIGAFVSDNNFEDIVIRKDLLLV